MNRCNQKPTVEWVTATAYPYGAETFSGGSFYDYLATEALGKAYDFRLTYVQRKIGDGIFRRLGKRYLFIKDLLHLDTQGDVVIRTHYAVAFVPFKKGSKNIAIIHQFYKHPMFDLYYIPFFFSNLKKIDVIVTVSRYWQDWFYHLGYKSIRVIYNPFYIEEFIFSDEEIISFRKKYKLPDDRPIIYVGSGGKGKGIEQTYHLLRDLDVHLVSSGKGDGSSIIKRLQLTRREYLCLLKCSSLAIQMSEFDEGWCRVLHEALLCRTPAIGSGRGGMGELLERSGQIICADPRALKGHVERLLADDMLRKEMGERGYTFASKFIYQRFAEDWTELISSLT